MAKSRTGSFIAIFCSGCRSLFELSTVLLALGDHLLRFWSYVFGVPLYLDIHSARAKKRPYLPFNGLVSQTTYGFVAHSKFSYRLPLFLSPYG